MPPSPRQSSDPGLDKGTNLRNFIKNKKKTNFSIGGVQVFIKDEVPETLDPERSIAAALELVPKHLKTNLDTIYIGDFKHLKDLEMQAMYMDSSIFLSNEIEEEAEIIDDIVHEIAHSVEEVHQEIIYSDGNIEREFLLKRKALWALLNQNGIEADKSNFLEVEYDREFDEFLYLEVGYPALSMYSSGLFYSPYAVTSLREYFANGFEAFFMREEVSRLKRISPHLFEKILNLMDLKSDNKDY